MTRKREKPSSVPTFGEAFYLSSFLLIPQEGMGWMDMTIHKGIRWSTASAYLRPALKRPNLKTMTKVLVTKVLLEGDRAVGVELIDKRGTV